MWYLGEKVLEGNGNKIVFKEIKTYEEAYYYNSNPEKREEFYINKPEDKKRNSKLSKSFIEVLGIAFEGILEIIFSILE